MDEYDFVIAGAGAAGLSLAYHLNQAGLTDRRVLLLDRAPKASNDRTWCFWERSPGPFQPVVFREWDRLAFFGAGFERTLDIAPYRYKMIRGSDFYAYLARWLAQQNNVEVVYGEISAIEQAGDGACVRLRDGRSFRGAWAFNSVQLTPPPRVAGRHYLLQHFLGWVIQTPDQAFDPRVATLMDFRVDQASDTRFVYVMPFDAHTALVEYTVFSAELLPRDAYVGALEGYIRDVLKLERFEEQHEEFGVIPMTDAPFPVRPSPNVMNIGTAGGRTKPSTGYTFQRIQRQSAQIAAALKATGAPFSAAALPERRFELFDSTLLNVLDLGRDSGKRVFTDLFSRNPAPRVFKFLDEETTLAEDVQIMSSVNLSAFMNATADVLWRKL